MDGLMFAGQGAQVVGMGRTLYDNFSVARDTFLEAEEASGLPLRALCFEGPEDRLTDTEVAQPAILTVDVAAYRVVQGDLTPVAAAGLSLGEYAALVAAEALDFAAAVRLVRLRGRLMQEAVPRGEGGMVAILGLDRQEVAEACREAGDEAEVAPANFNAPGQVVISGRMGALERAVEAARRRGARRAVPLRVSAPFHMTLLAPARRGLEGPLAATAVAPPRYPVFSNVDGEVHRPERTRTLLATQVDHPVDWEACVRAMLDAGADRLVELGPGSALRGFARRIAPDVPTVGIAEAADIEAVKLGLVR